MKQKQEQRAAAESIGELEEKVLFINRCSKVVKGGRKFSFAALILVGDRNGHIGFGFAKANELTDAIRKGGEMARKNVIRFERDGTTIPHEIAVKCDGAALFMKPASKGTGIIAGSVIRSVLEYAGVEDVVAKSLGRNNQINQARCVMKALSELRNKQEIMQMRGEAA